MNKQPNQDYLYFYLEVAAALIPFISKFAREAQDKIYKRGEMLSLITSSLLNTQTSL